MFMGFGSIARRLRPAGRHLRGRRMRLVLLVVGALGFLFPHLPASGQTIPPGIIPANGNYTPEQAQFLVNGVRYAEQVLPQYYGNAAALPAMGYVDIGVRTPGNYQHFVNVNMFNDAHLLNPRYPESLVFQNGQLKAAMLFTHTGTTMETIPQIIRFVPGWHAHPELCGDDTGRIVGFSTDGVNCIGGGRPVLIPMIHVWLSDPGCGHRFGGLDGGGLHCEYDEHMEH
jgi:hypothetical protein